VANSEALADEGKYALRDDEWSDAQPGTLNADKNRSEGLRAKLAPPAQPTLKGMWATAQAEGPSFKFLTPYIVWMLLKASACESSLCSHFCLDYAAIPNAINEILAGRSSRQTS
jgi:hypothetical protein